jgi:hypothetical protein
VTQEALRASAAFAVIGRFAAGAGEGQMPRRATIWLKSLFVRMYRPRQCISVDRNL